MKINFPRRSPFFVLSSLFYLFFVRLSISEPSFDYNFIISLEQNPNFQNVNKRTREVLKDQNRKQGITKQTSAKNAEIG